jgi:hypothetical protein
MLMTDDGGPPIPLSRLIAPESYHELVVNQAILRPDDRLRSRLEQVIDQLYAKEHPTEEARRALGTFRNLLERCFPLDRHISAEEREWICERAIKAVFLIPYMDEYNLDLTRLRSCVSMQAVPDGRLIPNCSYYPIHRLTDPRFFPQEGARKPMFLQYAPGDERAVLNPFLGNREK